MDVSPLVALGPQVWVYTARDGSRTQPNIGVICTAQHTILIDAGSSPRHARRVLADLYAQGFPPVRTLIYTHHHWDHVLGSTSYHPTRVIAHDRCAAALKSWTQRHWAISTLRDEIQRTPELTARNQAVIEVLEDWHEMRLAMPNLTFTDELTLYEDDLSITVRHVGGAYADDSVVVQTSSGVLFVGDCYTSADGSDALDITMLERLLSYGNRVIVDGHHAPRTPADIRALIADA